MMVWGVDGYLHIRSGSGLFIFFLPCGFGPCLSLVVLSLQVAECLFWFGVVCVDAFRDGVGLGRGSRWQLCCRGKEFEVNSLLLGGCLVLCAFLYFS